MKERILAKRKTAANMLDISVSTFDKFTKRQDFPNFEIIENIKFWRISDIVRWSDTHFDNDDESDTLPQQDDDEFETGIIKFAKNTYDNTA